MNTYDVPKLHDSRTHLYHLDAFSTLLVWQFLPGLEPCTIPNVAAFKVCLFYELTLEGAQLPVTNLGGWTSRTVSRLRFYSFQ